MRGQLHGASPAVTGAPGLLCQVQRIQGAECAGGGGSLSQAERFRAGRSPRLLLMGVKAGRQGQLSLELGTGPRRASATMSAEPLVSGVRTPGEDPAGLWPHGMEPSLQGPAAPCPGVGRSRRWRRQWGWGGVGWKPRGWRSGRAETWGGVSSREAAS